MKVLTLDFWDTLYRHRLTPESRKQIRDELLLDYCQRNSLSEPHIVSTTIFGVIDNFIKDSWKKGICPLPESVIENARLHYANRYTANDITELIQELNRIYTSTLKPDLFEGAANFLHWAKKRMALYLISDTYTVRGEALDQVLETDGLRDLFTNRFYSDAVGFEKPNVTSMQRVIDAERTKPEDIIHVGDLIDRDYELAKRIGCRFIWLQHQTSTPLPSGLDSVVFLGACQSFSELQILLKEF